MTILILKTLSQSLLNNPVHMASYNTSGNQDGTEIRWLDRGLSAEFCYIKVRISYVKLFEKDNHPDGELKTMLIGICFPESACQRSGSAPAYPT